MKTALLLSAFAVGCYVYRQHRRHVEFCRRVGAFYAEAIPG